MEMLVAAIAFLNSFPVSEFASVNHRQQLLNFSVGIGTIHPITTPAASYHHTLISQHTPITTHAHHHTRSTCSRAYLSLQQSMYLPIYSFIPPIHISPYIHICPIMNISDQ